METAKRVGLNIKEHRKAKGLSQAQLALEAELDMSYISEVESGQWNITINTALRIAHALGVKLADVLAGIDD